MRCSDDTVHVDRQNHEENASQKNLLSDPSSENTAETSISENLMDREVKSVRLDYGLTQCKASNALICVRI